MMPGGIDPLVVTVAVASVSPLAGLWVDWWFG